MAEGGTDFTVIPSQRNKNKLSYIGFVYLCNRKNEKKLIGNVNWVIKGDLIQSGIKRRKFY